MEQPHIMTNLEKKILSSKKGDKGPVVLISWLALIETERYKTPEEFA